MISANLVKNYLKFDSAFNRVEALSGITGNHFDFIITDCEMQNASYE